MISVTFPVRPMRATTGVSSTGADSCWLWLARAESSNRASCEESPIRFGSAAGESDATGSGCRAKISKLSLASTRCTISVSIVAASLRTSQHQCVEAQIVDLARSSLAALGDQSQSFVRENRFAACAGGAQAVLARSSRFLRR